MRLSERYGVNPSLMMCPTCGVDTAVALLGYMKGDEEAPKKILDNQPCEKCRTEFESYKEKGFIIFVLDDGAEEKRDWRFFNSLHVVTFEAAENLFEPEFRKSGACFMNVTTAKSIDLPVK